MEMLLFVHPKIPRFPVQWAVLTLLWGCGRRGHGKRGQVEGSSREVPWRWLVCQSWHRVLPPRGQLQVCSQERLAPLSYMISLCLFLYLLSLSLTMQGSGQDGWEHGWYQHVATSLQPQLPNPARLCPLQTCWDHGTQKPVSLDKERSRCWEQLGKIQMSGPRAWQCCQGRQDELHEIGMKEIPAKCRIDTVKMQGASLMWNRSWAWTISAYLYTAVAYADELRANTLENKVKSKKLQFSSTV